MKQQQQKKSNLTPEQKAQEKIRRTAELYTSKLIPKILKIQVHQKQIETSITKFANILTVKNPHFILFILEFLPKKQWLRFQQINLLYYKNVMPDLLTKCNSLPLKILKSLIFQKPAEIFRAKTITTIQQCGENLLLIAFNSGQVEIHNDEGNQIQSKKIRSIQILEWKRITSSITVRNDYFIISTDFGDIILIDHLRQDVLDQHHEENFITAMCHVSENFILMSHKGGFLSCWDITSGKFSLKSMLKTLVAGEVTRITRSPQHLEREVILASDRGCIFARINEKGYIVEELFEIYFQGKPLHFVGYLNFSNYFATTYASKQVYQFQRAQDDNHEFKVKELVYIEWTHQYISLIEGEWSIGHSGTKLYLHNFQEQMSYILLEDQLWNMRTEIMVVQISEAPMLKFKISYSVFDDQTYDDVVKTSILNLSLLLSNRKALEPCEYTFEYFK